MVVRAEPAVTEPRVDDAQISHELATRPSRSPDHAAEELATNPTGVLQKLVEIVFDLCHADSSGVGILEPGGVDGNFRWHAIAGAFARNLWGTMPCDAGLSDAVLARDAVLLVNEAERRFPDLRGVEPRIYENLLAPWHADGQQIGTLWAIKHTPEGQFDAEDARLLASLSRFAAAAWRTVTALREVESGRQELELRVAEQTGALRESEERQAFLLRLSDALRPLADPVAIQEEASRLLGEHLGANQVHYGEIVADSGEESTVLVRRSYGNGMPPLVGSFHLPAKGWGERLFATYHAGHTSVCENVETDPSIGAEEAAILTAAGFRAYVNVPLVKAGAWVAMLAVHGIAPRAWSAAEVALVEETAERTWAAVERASAETALRASEESLQRRVAEATAELRALSRRLLTVQEEERRSLARELHDEIGQVLTGLGLTLGGAAGASGARLAEARRIVAELTEQVRQLSLELRPAALDGYGLLPALRLHLHRFERRTGVRVDLYHEGLDRRFPAPVEIAAYRIVQEALTNVARHAGTTAATVQLYADTTALTVSIRDPGRGFAPAVMDGGSGLRGMRERTELLGGTLDVDAAPGAGVTVTAELPLGAPVPAPEEAAP
jgi:signal transduction histidine kinase